LLGTRLMSVTSARYFPLDGSSGSMATWPDEAMTIPPSVSKAFFDDARDRMLVFYDHDYPSTCPPICTAQKATMTSRRSKALVPEEMYKSELNIS
jgi:hypothetical protein